MRMFRVKLFNKKEKYIDRKVIVKGKDYKDMVSKLQFYMPTHVIKSFTEILI